MKRYKAFLGLGLALGLLSGCTDRFDDMNTNPGAVTDANLKYVLPYVEEQATRVDCTPYQRADNLYAQFYCQYFTNTTTGFTTDRYGYNDSWSQDGFWTPYYTVLKHMKVAKESAAANPSMTNVLQMIRIITAKNTIEMTDLYGDIPYFEAGLGNTQSRYDSQESIYRDVFKELTEAASTLSQNLAGQETCSADNDLIFAGDTQKWMRLANSLRLRYARRLASVDPDLSRQEAEAALKAGVMESNDDNAYIECRGDGGGAGWGHPLYQMASWHGFAISSTFYDILCNLSSVEDPRKELWIGLVKQYADSLVVGHEDNYVGEKFIALRNGMNDTEIGLVPVGTFSEAWGLQAFPDYNSKGDASAVGTSVILPLKIMNYAEVCLLKAEAALRGYSGAGSAQQNYEDGIRASFADERSFLSDAKLSDTSLDDTYITTGDVAWSSDPQKQLEQIITQKWLALYPSGVEAWAEVRRTGYPAMIPVMHSEDPNINPANGEFITKIRYIDSERRENAANALSPSLNQGQGDGSTVKVWWHTADGQ